MGIQSIYKLKPKIFFVWTWLMGMLNIDLPVYIFIYCCLYRQVLAFGKIQILRMPVQFLILATDAMLFSTRKFTNKNVPW